MPPRGFAGDAIGLKAVQTEGIVRAVGLAEAIGEIYERLFGKGGFELIREHALPADFGGHGWCLLSVIVSRLIA
jgi:hypothetical protein